jgi:response regulator RpfG family c-di-GMP phosphodiesterase
MTSNVFQLPSGPHWRVLIAHQRADVRHALRTLVESENVSVVEASDGDDALARLEYTKFDLLVLELDLPNRDGVTLMKLHRVLLAHERIPVEPPAVILTLAPEVRNNPTLLQHLESLGVAALIDDAPRPDVAPLVDGILQARAARRAGGKPAAA